MFCEPCRRERPFGQFCVLCGSKLIERATPLIEADLDRVRWLLDEVAVWDESLAPTSARRAIAEYYRRQEAALASALSPDQAMAPVQESPTQVEMTQSLSLPLLQEEAWGEGEPRLPPPSPLIPVASAPPPPPAPREPSRWQLTWKPLLHESLGWFLGAFLILSGALYLVRDAWDGMTSSVQALTVFGLVEVWAVGFALWAAALARKDTTRPAAVILRRIGALIAPLAVLALDVGSLFSWFALAAGAALAGRLAFSAAKDLEEPDAPLLAASVSLATFGLGLTPVLPAAGGWLSLVPAVLAGFAFRPGPRSTAARTGVTLLAFLLPVAALATRLLISVPHSQSALAAIWVVSAGLASAALWLREEKNRGTLTIVAMSIFFVAFAGSFVSVAPACVLIAVLGVWTTARLSKDRAVSPRSAWWLAGTYAFAYLAWQRVDQLVPAIVWTWWDQVKLLLGYAAAPMPASYASVYQALFVAVGTLIAGWRWHRSSKHERSLSAHIWLRCSAVAGAAAGALAMISVSSDARPALVALPLLLLPLLAVGFLARRADAMAAGSVLSVFFAFALGLTVAPGWPAAVVALLLALGAHALPVVRETRVPRRWLSGAALASGGVAFILAGPLPGAVALFTLVLSSVACVLAARALHRQVVVFAWFSALIPLGALESPAVVALVALTGAVLLVVRGRRWRTTIPALASMAIAAPAWSLAHATHVDLKGVIAVAAAGLLAALPLRRAWWVAALVGGTLTARLVPSVSFVLPAGWVWLSAALALGVMSAFVSKKVRGALEAPALVGLVVSIAPGLGLWPDWSHAMSLLCAAVFTAIASVHAVLKGRTWQGSLLAALGVAAALATAQTSDHSPVAIAAVLLLATPALLAWLTVPAAALVLGLAWFSVPYALLGIAVVTAFVALLEESDWAWRNLLNQSSLTLAASLTSAAALAGALLHGPSLALSLAAALLPLVWARANRRAEPLALGVAFAAVAGPWWCALVIALLAGRLLPFAVIRRALGLPTLEASPERLTVEHLALFLASAAVAALSVAVEPAHAAAWFAVLLLMGGVQPAVRLAVAVAIAVPFEPMRAPAVGVLVALGAAAHHAPVHLKRLLGVRSLHYVEPLALLLAIAGAASLTVITPMAGSPLALLLGVAMVGFLMGARLSQGTGRRAFAAGASVALGGVVALLAPQWMLPVTVGVGAVLLGVPGLIPVAILAAGLDVHASLQRLEPMLAAQGFAIATVAALLAMALRSTRVSAQASALWRWMGRESETALCGPLFWGAVGLSTLLLAHRDPRALWLAPLLLVTARRAEAVVGLLFSSLAAAVLLPSDVSVPLVGIASLGFAWAGTRYTQLRVAPVWRQASWVLALLGMVLAGIHLESPLIPLAWSVGAATSWLLLREKQGAQGWAWAATGVALHVVMAFVGVVLSTGAPKVLIFPWWAAASAALALLRQLRGGRNSVHAFAWVALSELALGTCLLASAQPREAVLSVLVAGVLAFIAWRRMVEEDERPSAWLGQCAVVAGALAARVLGMGAMPDLTDAWVLLGVSALFAGLAQFFGREGRDAAAKSLRQGAMAWPLLGAVLVPWHTWSLGAAWLLGLSVLAAWIARSGSRRSGAIVSALSLNAAIVFAALGSGFGSLQLLLIPLGATVLVLARFFVDELSAATTVKLRAWGMGLMYVAVAWTPLTVTSVPALMLCVLVCLGGIALGTHWRIRSYVVLGTGVLVTTVLATLVRSGLAEPRLGAVFLSLLGLAVVVVMVMISTRREELQARLAAMQRVMATWEG